MGEGKGDKLDVVRVLLGETLGLSSRILLPKNDQVKRTFYRQYSTGANPSRQRECVSEGIIT